jgi:hypothetical protein
MWSIERMLILATEKQINFILNLYDELGQEPEDDVEQLSNIEASQRINELLEIKKDR